jgi:hypothetical protein
VSPEPIRNGEEERRGELVAGSTRRLKFGIREPSGGRDAVFVARAHATTMGEGDHFDVRRDLHGSRPTGSSRFDRMAVPYYPRCRLEYRHRIGYIAARLASRASARGKAREHVVAACQPDHGGEQMSETRTYTGGCHCGEVRFEVTVDISSVVSCNCSLCQKRGALWAFVTPESFALRAGLEQLRDYQFGKRTIHHLFCPQCGVGAFSRGSTPKGAEMVAINVRCLDDVDPGSLQQVPFDGRSL